MDRQVSDPAMTGDPGRTVDFRLWPPVAIGAPLLVGWVATTAWGDPVDLGGWRVPVGVALLVVVTGLVVTPLLCARRRPGDTLIPFVVKPIPTLLIGIVGGLIVGVTSVGSGSLIIIMLLMLYPRMKLSELVGTDLVQAVPLVTSAALGHLFFGSFKLGLTASILIGSVPGAGVTGRGSW